MIEPVALPRHIDGSVAIVEQPHIRVTFQHGAPQDEGINGCRLEDLVDVLVDKLLDFQARSLACPENETALYHLGLAKDALNQRRKHREQQGVLGTASEHKGS